MIPESAVTSRARDKARRFAFQVLTNTDGTFQLKGKAYTGKVERRGATLFVGCSCPARFSRTKAGGAAACYHLPFYLDEFTRREMIASIRVGDEIEYVVPMFSECNPDRHVHGVVEAVELVAVEGTGYHGANGYVCERERAFKIAGAIRLVTTNRVARVVRRQVVSSISVRAQRAA